VKDAGFAWAPKQEIFVAGMWTPQREDLLIEMCGEIGDEDTSLVDRAEDRAERFEGYSERRAEDASRAKRQVEAIAGGIPMGQPILVGHHSERHARRDAEKIENGMRKAVKMWETAKYWESRAAGAVRAAKYKERPDVRHRRIKGLEADKRKQEKTIAEVEQNLSLWEKVCGPNSTVKRTDGEEFTPTARAVYVLGRMSSYNSRCFPLADFPRALPASQYEGQMSLYSALDGGVITVDQAEAFFRESCAARVERVARWLAHYENRIAYERAMLGEAGGIVAERFNIAVGGRVLIGHEWLLVLKLNKAGGKLASVTTNGAYVAVRGVEEIKDYREPDAQEALEVRSAMKLPPICNYPGEGFRHMTRAEYDAEVPKWSDFPKIRTIKGTEAAGAHRVRCNRAPGKPSWEYAFCYITDEKRKDPPKPAAPVKLERVIEPQARPAYIAPEPTEFDAMRDTLRNGGVQAVSAPQLFPTPPELAALVVERAGIESGQCVLEPSAGTGNLERAVLDRVDTEVLAYEINLDLCLHLGRTFPSYKLQARCVDFLQVTDFMGCYERIVMNPPFADSQDIAHVRHAYGFLKPGGRLVAIMGEGAFFRGDRKATEFREWLEAVGGECEKLPAGSFEASGTGVNTRLVVIDKGGAA
jgi:protein-L-isoaspartate O-methyltransferase